MLLQRNEEMLLVLNGDTLELHPRDKVRILKVSTSVTFNVGVRLYAGGFDFSALSFEQLPMATLLPKEAMIGEQRFQVQIKHLNRDIGYFSILVRPFVEDWLDKAERVIEPARKIEVLEEALKFAPEEKRIRARLLQEYKSQRKWREAALILESMSKEREDPQILRDLADAYDSMNNVVGLLTSLKRLVQIQPDDTKLRLRYASALEHSKKTKEAIAEYEEAVKKAERGEKIEIYKTLGYLCSVIGENARAIQNYVNAFELNRDDPNLCYNLSTLYERAGDQERSDQYLSEAIRLNPEDSEGRARLTEHLVKRGKFDEAEKHLSELLRKSPDSMNALLLMSQVAEKKKDLSKLKELYTRILALEPDNQTVMYNLGILTYEAGDLQASLPLIEKYAKAHPAEGEIHNILFDIYRRQKKDDLAFKEAQTVASMNPKDYAPYSYIFEYLNGRGDYGKIIEIAEARLKDFPENVDLRNYLVLAFLNTGKEDLALVQMKEIQKLTPKNVELLLQIARIQEKKGKSAEAMRTYEKILVLAPEHEEASEAYLRLRMGDLPNAKE